ncbi:MAG: group III truncated hemoglobin [Chitinophaga sp.]|uniref:group III truncated hemoglobin n=1 Tax=Chitinophaga sp. TaxID=1869181 RepID=UPI0025BF8FAA|nr:group III truncated hemoglobin [Chitinophaga sp.]MBV8255221.1 group III truncated hemoglobin [Chitinophaga sp.]
MERREIKMREDIELLVNSFYDKVQKDEVIGFIFNDIAKVKWSVHLPKMYNFWESLLLNGSYSGNAMEPHFRINKLIPLEPAHFQRWLQLFEATVHELFTGEVSDLAITRAKSIAEILKFKMNSINHPDQNNKNIPLVNPGNQKG